MTRIHGVIVAGAVAALLIGCGDDGGGDTADASQSADSGQNVIDARVTGPDAPPPIDATPLPPDASTVGRACSFPNETIMLSSAGAVSLGMICWDPATGANCRIIGQGQSSCFNDQEGFAFGIHNTMGIRSIAPVSGMSVTGFTGSGQMAGNNVINVTDGTPGSVTGQTSTGQSYTLQYEYNGMTVSLPSMTGP